MDECRKNVLSNIIPPLLNWAFGLMTITRPSLLVKSFFVTVSEQKITRPAVRKILLYPRIGWWISMSAFGQLLGFLTTFKSVFLLLLYRRENKLLRLSVDHRLPPTRISWLCQCLNPNALSSWADTCKYNFSLHKLNIKAPYLGTYRSIINNPN